MLAQPNAQASRAAALTHRHTPCVSARHHAHAGSSPRGHSHAHLPPRPGPLHTNMACTHTHTLTHARSLGQGGAWRGGVGLQLWPPPHPATSKPWAATPRTELCNWVENCKKTTTANWKQTQTHAQKVNLKSIAHPPAPPHRLWSRGPVGVGGPAFVLPCGGGPPPARGGSGAPHSEGGRLPRSCSPWLHS